MAAEKRINTLDDHLSPYERWQKREGIPVIGGYYIADLATAPVEEWKSRGARGAFVNLEGAEEFNDAYLLEIPARAELEPTRFLYEEMIYVVSGRGATSVWYDEDRKQTFEWQAGSLFSIPLNAWRRHVNLQSEGAARFFAVTTAPLVINLFHNDGFVFDNGFRFLDRFNQEEEFFSGKGVSLPWRGWDTNFVSDVASMKLHSWSERGAGGSNVMLELADGTLGAHISEMPVGTYKKAHRHGPGAHVIIISGEGYSLMWPEGKKMEEIPWKPGSVLVPPNMWFHQHFNTGPEPARYLALRLGSMKHRLGKAWDPFLSDKNVKEGGMQIDYDQEDPWVHRHYEELLAKNGVQSKMNVFLESKE